MNSSSRIASLSPDSRRVDDDLTEAAIFCAKYDYAQLECEELRAKLADCETTAQAQRAELSRENVALVLEIQHLRARAQISESKLAEFQSKPSQVPVATHRTRKNMNDELQDAAKALNEAELNISRGSAKKRSISQSSRTSVDMPVEPALEYLSKIDMLETRIESLQLDKAKERVRADKYKQKALEALKLVEKTVDKSNEIALEKKILQKELSRCNTMDHRTHRTTSSNIVNLQVIADLEKENHALLQEQSTKHNVLQQLRTKITMCEVEIRRLHTELHKKEEQLITGIDQVVGELAETQERKNREFATQKANLKEKERSIRHLAKKIQSAVHTLQAEEIHAQKTHAKRQAQLSKAQAEQERAVEKETKKLLSKKLLSKPAVRQQVQVQVQSNDPRTSVAMFIPYNEENECKVEDSCTCNAYDHVTDITSRIHQAGQFCPSHKLNHTRHIVNVQVPQQPVRTVYVAKQPVREQAPWGVHADIKTRYVTRPAHQQHHTTFPTPF